MSSKNVLVKKLDDQTDEVQDFLDGLAKNDALPQNQLNDFQWELTRLRYKDIPPEQCSTGKIVERIFEVESLLDDIKSELESKTR